MAEDEKEFLKRLLAMFSIEAREHLASMYARMSEIEKAEEVHLRDELVEIIFREVHSLKGASASVGLTQVERACQALENTMAAIKRKEIALDGVACDGLYQSLDRLSQLVGEFISTEDQAKLVSVPPVTEAEPAAKVPVSPPARMIASLSEEKIAAGTVRITTEKLDSIFLKAEEMLGAKLFAQHRKQELQQLNSEVVAWGKSWANIKVRHPEFYQVVAQHPQWLELIEDNAVFIKKLMHDLSAICKTADQDQRMLGRMTDELLDGMKTALLLPCSMLLDVLPKLVRALAKDQGKDIELVTHGGELEIDRRILEEIKDPIIHLVRNCADHGIEPVAVRAERGKKARGRIEISVVSRSGDWVELKVRDDGAGINVDKVKHAAQRMGLIDEAAVQTIDDLNAIELVFQSGISTSPIVTELSGRGLGLAIVREKILKLGGTISIESRPNEGTCFRMMLPNTLATYRGILVRVGEHQFVIPIRNVERSLRVRLEAVTTVENLETLRVGDETLAFVRLGDVLGIPPVASESAFLAVMVLSVAGKKIAFSVDEIVNEQEVLVKGLGKQLARVRNIEAATILGSGKAVPVLNAADLIKSAMHQSDQPRPVSVKSEREDERQKSVLVVEDSITARSLLKGILEMAGYQVATAVDGAEGLAKLINGNFDIVVSDVEMPRMDGFDLTARIRADKRLQDTPVILVTALESQADRERGIDVGANAYIVKRSFEQSNLLEVLERLV